MALRKRVSAWLGAILELYVDKPYHCFGCGCFLLLGLSAVAVVTGTLSLTIDQQTSWNVHRSASTQAWESWRQSISRNSAAKVQARRMQQRTAYPQQIDLWYKATSGPTIFTPGMLRDICRLESAFLQADSGVCRETGGLSRSDCRSWSISSLFYGGFFLNATCPLLPQASVDSTIAMIAEAVAAEGPSSRNAFWISPDFVATNLTLHTRYRLYIGNSDPALTKEFLLETWCHKFEPPQRYGLVRSAFGGDWDRMVQFGSVRVRYYFPLDEAMRLLPLDFLFCICSIVFVWAVMYLHTGSLFVASLGMWQIAASLPIGALVYRKVFMVDYFDFLHVLVVYLVIGVGADDIFVLFDTWSFAKASFWTQWGTCDVKGALRQTWFRAGGAIFNTSFTTGVAFLSMSGSNVMPMRTCGWFAAIAIFMNFLFTLVFMPSLLVLHHLHFGGKRCCCPKPITARDSTPTPDGQENPLAARGGTRIFSVCVERALRCVYLSMMRKRVGIVKPAPLFLVLSMLALAIQGAYFTSQLTPPTKTEEWWPSNHMWRGLDEFVSETFLRQESHRYSETVLVWGLSEMNFDTFNEYRPDDYPPHVRFDGTFDLSTREAQQALLETCRDLRELPCTLSGCRGGKVLLQASGRDFIHCVLEDFQRWLQDTQNVDTMPTGPAFHALLERFRQVEVSANYTNASHPALKSYSEQLGFSGGRLQSVSVTFVISMLDSEPYASGSEVRSFMDDFVQRRIDAMPTSMKSLKVANREFVRYDLSQELVSSLLSGMTIAGPLVFVVLLISTQNIVLAIFAFTSVGAILVSVLGFCKSVMDYDLGIGESIAGIIVTGYSVDYVLHLAHMYKQAGKQGLETRDDRSSYTVEQMGSTVFAGAITTGGSGSFMLICYITFFTKMAVLICLTIMFSFLYSMLFFMGLCFLAGPERDFGSICCCTAKSSRRDNA